MMVIDILNYVLLLSLFTSTSFAYSNELGDNANGYSNEPGDLVIVESGFGFNYEGSVSGIGFTNTHSHINANPEILQTRSSGSGSYSYDSAIRLIDFTANDPGNGFTNAERSIELQENTSFVYSPFLPSNEGSFRSGLIKSLWGDSITTGNGGGAHMRVGFDNTRVLSKDVHTKVSGFENLEDILSSSGVFNTGIKFSAAFTGNEKLDVSLKEPNKKNPKTLVDEYYSGTFRMTKNLGLKVDSSIWDYGETSEDMNAISWLPCACNAGWDGMDLHDQRYHSAEGFFNFSTCERPKPCSNKLM